MRKLSLPKPHLPTKALFVGLGIVLIVALLLYGMARQEQRVAADTAHNRAVAVAQQKQLDSLKAQVNSLTADLTTANARGNAACTELTRLASVKANAKIVTVPAICSVHPSI